MNEIKHKEETKSQQLQTEKVIIEERQYIQEQIHQQPMQQPMQQEQEHEISQQEIMDNSLMLEEEKPKFVATVDDAYDIAHSEQRLGYKERKRVKKQMAARREQGSIIANQFTAADESYDKRRALAVSDYNPYATSYANARVAMAFFDFSGTDEAYKKNDIRFNMLCRGTQEDKFTQYDQMFDEILAIDLNRIQYRNEAELLEKRDYIISMSMRGVETISLISTARREGMVIDRERLYKLRAKAHLLEDAAFSARSHIELIKSPYYQLLGAELTNSISSKSLEKQLAQLASIQMDETEEDVQRDRFLSKLSDMRSFTDKGFGHAADLNIYYEKLSAIEKKKVEREEKDRDLAALPEEKQVLLQRRNTYVSETAELKRTWKLKYAKDSKGRDLLPTPSKNAQVKSAGIADRPVTQRSLIYGIFMNRTGKTYADELSAEDKVLLTTVQSEVGDLISVNNTNEAASVAFAEMGRGLLANRQLLMKNYSTLQEISANLPALEMFVTTLKDFEQLTAGNKEAGDMAMAMLTAEEREELYQFICFETFFTDFVRDYGKLITSEAYEDMLLERPVTDDAAELQRVAIDAHLNTEQETLTALATSKTAQGHFRFPAGATHTYKYWYMTLHYKGDIAPDIAQGYLEADKMMLDEMYGRTEVKV